MVEATHVLNAKVASALQSFVQGSNRIAIWSIMLTAEDVGHIVTAIEQAAPEQLKVLMYVQTNYFGCMLTSVMVQCCRDKCKLSPSIMS
eukprot:m.153942 g.153942  ORF g.153942 m.153942 type:complete len:89 (+) comp14296_c0_seq2:125-391(+)